MAYMTTERINDHSLHYTRRIASVLVFLSSQSNTMRLYEDDEQLIVSNQYKEIEVTFLFY